MVNISMKLTLRELKKALQTGMPFLNVISKIRLLLFVETQIID